MEESDKSSTDKRNFPLIQAAIALVFVLIGGAVAYGALSCGSTNFSISLKDGLHFICSPGLGPTTEPTGDTEGKISPGQIGFTYYGRKDSGDPSDSGMLRPANGAPLPLTNAIRAGDVFKGVAVKQLRESPSNTSAAVGQMPIGTCFQTIQITNAKSFGDGEGAWLQVKVVHCP